MAAALLALNQVYGDCYEVSAAEVEDPQRSRRDEVHEMRARVATPAERARLWPIATEAWPAYDDYQAKTTREIPLVICEPR